MLLLLDHRFALLDKARSLVLDLVTPLYQLADLPADVARIGGDSLTSKASLKQENTRLKAEALVLQAKVQKLAALAAENVRLKELLNSSAILQDNVLAAEIVAVSPNPNNQFVIINKGLDDQIFVGQPVIDAYGLFGQVIEVAQRSSRVLMISDTSHSVPVHINRNGVRSIVEGKGLLHELTLKHVPATADVKEGDILVTSGLGQRFPVGYPVAKVIEVVPDPGQPFAIVTAVPSAQLDRSRHVLLVFTPQGSSALADQSGRQNHPGSEPAVNAGSVQP